ncbi:multicopper oxidase domain-containing protein [Methylomonas sp. LL1]|uniref:multicopper oxidase domain-containing protein n=1 Tax=Methylomonas sp. LL1 TaxID=2785785 RepID=UPI0018C420CD|nr:multicopper oxidase domain-containing protein [Methylomonas sp. LL1]
MKAKHTMAISRHGGDDNIIQTRRCLFKTKQGIGLDQRHFRHKKTILALAVLSCIFAGTNLARAAFNIPTTIVDPVTGLLTPEPSPLCINGSCATEFSAKLLLFEEFGLKNMSDSSSTPSSSLALPEPMDCQGIPDGKNIYGDYLLDDFLKEDLNSAPSRAADTTKPNPWDAKVRACVGLTPETPTTADGRPSGEWFAHQRWDEFLPQVYFQSAITGARVNGGLRDKRQLHEYKVGEFGPGGLYYLDANGDGKPGSEGVEIKIHPNLPTQAPNSVWTFDGTLPPKLLMARYGEPILFRNYNALPIDPGANNGFGYHTISTHEHNGHNPAESDGYMHAYFYPGQFYDYHWPMVLAGHDSINTQASDPRAGAPDGSGGIIPVRGDWRETMSTHWFHDHMLDYTAQNVYKGNAAMMNYYSALDRGNEGLNDGVNLRFPSGTALDWGNRDYDMNLLVADKAWDNNGQLKFNIFNTDGYLGDQITVNWVYKPYVDVRARRYRFRILNGSVSRYYKIAVVDQAGKIVPSHMIANDGNIMQHAVPFPNASSAQGALPEQAIAERYDIIVDFKGMEGKKVYLVNLLEHVDGRGPNKIVALTDILSGKYRADGKNGDPGVGKFLEFRVQNYSGTDLSMNPADYVEGKKQMIPLNKPTTQELQAAIHRTFEFGRSSGTDTQPWTIKTDAGDGLLADPHRVSAAPELPANPSDLGKVEIWHIKGGIGWSHPVHVHFEEGQILYRGGKAPPPWEKYARKDVYRVGNLTDTSSIDIAIRTREFAGTYVEHCHNTQHEDKAMLLRWDSQNAGQTLAIPTPMPDWGGVEYDPSISLPTYKTGDLAAKKSFVLPK